jgi:hypothetical protein
MHHRFYRGMLAYHQAAQDLARDGASDADFPLSFNPTLGTAELIHFRR